MLSTILNYININTIQLNALLLIILLTLLLNYGIFIYEQQKTTIKEKV
jgi:hypothetical protein